MTLLLHRHAPDDLVAYGGAGPRTANDLRVDARSIAARLDKPSATSRVLLVFRNDRYAFAAAMLGALEAGHSIALPPSTRREGVWAVSQGDDIIAILHDTESGTPGRVTDWLSDGASPTVDPLVPLAPDRLVATLYSSGTTGRATGHAKTARQLFGEVDALARTFGLTPAMRYASTVSPQHIYGLLFSVLVPLSTGGAFDREQPFHPGAVADRIASGRADVLVTVPTHLRTLVSFADEIASVSRVFSSTAPLRQKTALALAERALPVTEILGSTETGGYAWRCQSDGARWSALPHVRFDIDEPSDRLVLTSPFASPEGEPVVTDDRVRLHGDGTLSYLGRADDVLKIGGRRVALGDIEQRLLDEDGVEDAVVLASPDDGHRGSTIHAVVAPADVDTDALREALMERFEPSTLPRRIHAVARLPRAQNGKLLRARVFALLGRDPAGRKLSWDIAFGQPVLETGDTGHRATISAQLPTRYGWFEGHFEGYPVLAAAVQLNELVAEAWRRVRPTEPVPRRWTRLKFAGRIVPEDSLMIEFDWSRPDGATRFWIRRGDTICSSGVAHGRA